jgi:hypothetical protein
MRRHRDFCTKYYFNAHPHDSFGIIRMADYYTANMRSAGAAPAGSGLFTVIILILAGIALYYLYTFLTTDVSSDKVVLVPGKHEANIIPEKLPKMPTPYEGGEYTFSTWIYVNSFNTNMNRRKHIFEIKGTHFSTLLVALGAFKNTLVVRTHNKDVNESFQSFQGAVIPKAIRNEEGFAATTASTEGDLAAEKVNKMFESMTTDDTLSEPKTMCDLPEIDMQRWVMITVVLSGRSIDVYLDGKLARSCVTKSYFKVDPTGVLPKISERGGFDGHISEMSVANYAMNPAEIYRMYIAGPEGATLDIVDWVKSLFTG